MDELGIAFDYEDAMSAQDAPRRFGFSPPTCTRPSTASSRTSFSTICCGSWLTLWASSRARSSCGLHWWRFVTSKRVARACPSCGSTIRAS